MKTFYQIGNAGFGPQHAAFSSHFRTLASAKKRAQGIANRTGRLIAIVKASPSGRERVALVQEQESKRGNPAKAIRLKNFTGTVRLNPNKTVSVVGRKKKTAKKR